MFDRLPAFQQVCDLAVCAWLDVTVPRWVVGINEGSLLGLSKQGIEQEEAASARLCNPPQLGDRCLLVLRIETLENECGENRVEAVSDERNADDITDDGANRQPLTVSPSCGYPGAFCRGIEGHDPVDAISRKEHGPSPDSSPGIKQALNRPLSKEGETSDHRI